MKRDSGEYAWQVRLYLVSMLYVGRAGGRRASVLSELRKTSLSSMGYSSRLLLITNLVAEARETARLVHFVYSHR